MVLPLQKLIHLHTDSDCESDSSEWDGQLSKKKKKKATKRIRDKKSSLLSKITKPLRSRRSATEPPKSQDTTADLNGYVDAHKSPSVEAPITRVSVCRKHILSRVLPSSSNTMGFKIPIVHFVPVHYPFRSQLGANTKWRYRSGLYKDTMVVLMRRYVCIGMRSRPQD